MSVREIDDQSEQSGVWVTLAAPLNPSDISWRQDGKPVQRNGKYVARFVCYVEAGTVRERLDSVVPGNWDLTLELLRECADSDGQPIQAFKARLTVLGVIREDVGQGSDYKQAATDAFKRAAVRFGIGHELYAMEQNWVEVDGDSKYAKPVEDPQAAYDRKYGSGEQRENPTSTNGSGVRSADRSTGRPTGDDSATSESALPSAFDPEQPSCPKCGGRVWDNRITKRNPKAPDFKCRDRNCDGVMWPAKQQGNAMDADDVPTGRSTTRTVRKGDDSEQEIPF